MSGVEERYDESVGDVVYCAGETPWVVEGVEAACDYTLKLSFKDGSVKVFDFKPLVDKPMYRALQDTDLFMQARAGHGTVVWDNDIDIAPEYLYENAMPISARVESSA
ncbi:MAG: DUF2442 domain-containing protein [Atopobiaceae bacterium]|nr:DUF2442 domain-containing protein [Atopobiaceae bacterium]MDY4650993.1 DUF2442 domain-containing protein [Atopobiaceae bacterium]